MSKRWLAARLGAGMLLTMAVAWASALLVPFPNSHTALVQRGLSERDWWLVARIGAPAGVRYCSVVMPRALQYEELPTRTDPPGWARLPAPVGSTAVDPSEHYELAEGRGWPM